MNVNAHRAAVNALPPCGRRPRAGVCGVAAGAAPRMRALPVRGRHGLRAPHRLPGRLLRALRRVAPLLARGRPPRAPPRRPRPQGRWVTPTSHCHFSTLAPQGPSTRWNITRHFPSFSVLPVEVAWSQPLLDTAAIMRILAERLRKMRNTVTYSIAKMGIEWPWGV